MNLTPHQAKYHAHLLIRQAHAGSMESFASALVDAALFACSIANSIPVQTCDKIFPTIF